MASRWLSDEGETWMKFPETAKRSVPPKAYDPQAALPPEHEAPTVKPRFEVPPPRGDSHVELRFETPRLPSDRPPEPRVETPGLRDKRVTHVGLVALRKRPLVVATAVCALGAPVLAHVAVSRVIRDRAASEPTSTTHEATRPAPAPAALDSPFSPSVDSPTAAAPTLAPSEVAARAAATAPRSKAHSPRSKRGIRPGSH
jgi:hypothetical protein